MAAAGARFLLCVRPSRLLAASPETRWSKSTSSHTSKLRNIRSKFFTSKSRKGESMSLFRSPRWTRREVLKQSGILSPLGVATAPSPFAEGATALADPQAQYTLAAWEGTAEE